MYATIPPRDDYDPAWIDYWAANPHLLRSVGAAAADDPPADPGPSPDPAPPADPAPTPPADPAPDPKPDPQPSPEPKEPTDWRTAITNPDLRKHAERFTSVADVVRANLDSRQKLSRAIIPPGKNASDEEIAEYRKKIGVPDSPEGYKFEATGELTDADKAFHQTMAQAFHGLNITADQAKGLNKIWNDYVAATQQALQEADEAYARESEAALKTEWGEEYERNRTFASRAAQQLFGDEFETARHLEDKNGRLFLDNPLIVKALARLGREMGEDRIGSVMSDGERDSVQEQIRGLRDKRREAMQKGDRAAAQRYDEQERALWARLDSGPIVGAQGRTV